MNSYIHGYKVSYLGPTDTKGSRIKISTESGSITIPFKYALSTVDAAIEELKKRGVRVTGYTSVGSSFNEFYVVLAENFVSLRKTKY